MALAQKTTYTEEDYYNLPEDVRAELIDGQIYYQVAPGLIHQTISGELHTAINNYIKSKKGSCRVFAAPFAVKLFDSGSTIVEPDISVICDRSKLTDRGCSGAPDWIIEIISPGNPEHDLIYKLGLYARAGVREYWIADPRSETILVYYLEQKNFEIRAYSFESKIKVNIFNDFEIDFRELDL
ncbi:Uma2 family endonuclease [Otoolea muris]|uniref:Uma2 family endonuclease n=1 Tax=Otoolea muris TaxID=2941515 RepID=UPI002040A58A|nr:Uma2 family endonuclease [Otoolea muris]